ncbi:MAG: hypothetical protein LBM23_01375 [Propionibacteriaceae bacterium]|jgi:hypothetical protein|nr:hypothetical protein [Propionibacteriaceae bacterium]
MVFGIDVFARHFHDFENRYVLIGGTACQLVLSEQGQSFRATKDLDIVIVAETVDAAYIARFLEFVELGGYRHISRSSGNRQYYRFDAPDQAGYPAMLELFSRRPETLENVDTHLGRVRVEDAPHSLSAILLDDDYYRLLMQGVTVIADVPVLDLEHLPTFKMKAWLELTATRARGTHVNSGDIAKHKNDVFRLVSVIEPDTRVLLPASVRNDVRAFLDSVPLTSNDLVNLGIRGYSPDEIRELIAEIYSV